MALKADIGIPGMNGRQVRGAGRDTRLCPLLELRGSVKIAAVPKIGEGSEPFLQILCFPYQICLTVAGRPMTGGGVFRMGEKIVSAPYTSVFKTFSVRKTP